MMKNIMRLVAVCIFMFLVHAHHANAQQNKQPDPELWVYNDAADIDSVHLHTYYKIEAYNAGNSYWTKYMNTFEANGLIYFQLFLAIPLYSEKEKVSSYTKDDTLMMFLNEDYSYREVRSPVYEQHAYAWYGLVFEKNVSSTLSSEEIEKAKLKFIADAKYELRDLERSKKIEYFQRIDSGYEYESYIKAINPKGKRLPIVFIPKYEPFK